jgi:hypothetical protein
MIDTALLIAGRDVGAPRGGPQRNISSCRCRQNRAICNNAHPYGTAQTAPHPRGILASYRRTAFTAAPSRLAMESQLARGLRHTDWDGNPSPILVSDGGQHRSIGGRSAK